MTQGELPIEDPHFLIDRNIPIAVACAMSLVRTDVVIHDTVFPANMPDQELLKEIGEHSWCFVTRDKKIRRRRPEVNALMRSGVRTFLLLGGSGNMAVWPQMQLLVRRWDDMRDYAMANSGPYIVGVTSVGRLKEIMLLTP